MLINISKNLCELYVSKKRNMDYSLKLLLDSMDPETCQSAINLVDKLELGIEKVNVEISDDNISAVRDLVEKNFAEEKTVELLLWVAILYPEV